MPISRRSSAEVFAQKLRNHGLDAANIADVPAAWQAFSEFVQLEIDGIDPDPRADADGFIVEWAATPGTTIARR